MLNKVNQTLQRALNDTSLAHFFNSPSTTGRRVICSFSYVQRIRKRGVVDVWFPSELHRKIAERLTAGDMSVLKELGVEWAAIREFALVQEAEYEEDFNPERLLKAINDSTKWRGQDGYRMTVVMLGNYTKITDQDELKIHDDRLQKEITNLIHMLYLEKESEEISDKCETALGRDSWSCSKALPHITINLQSIGMTGRGTAQSKKCAGIVQNILDIVEHLPKTHIVHDIAVGISLPDFNNKQVHQRLIEGWEKFSSFQRLLTNFFEPLGHKSMSALQGTGDAPILEYRKEQMRGFRELRASDDTRNLVAAESITNIEKRLVL